MKLRKIPLEALMQILEDLYETGADFIDIDGDYDSGENRDLMKITVRPGYMMSSNNINPEEELEIDYIQKDPMFIATKFLSDEDINDLI